MSKKKRPFSIDDLWALARIGSPTISPDGHLACVSVTRYEMGENNSTTNLWLLSTDGKTRRQLTRGKNDGEPQFSPDGKSIAFVAKRHADDLKDQIEASHLYVIDLNGGEARRLTSIDTGVFGIRWLPDGKHIAFMSYSWPDGKTEAEQNMRAAKEKSNKVKAVISERNHYRYWDHWLPEGRRVHVWRVPASGGKAKDLLAGDRSWLPATEPNAGMYDFSPNGRSMAFVQEREADPKAPIYSDIVLLDLRTGDIKNLTAGSDLTHEHPRFSPNGRQIACLTTDVGKAYNEQSRLALIDPVKASVRVLTGDWDFGVNAPIEWRADGNALVFSAEQREIQPLFEMLIDGSAPREISRGPGHGGSTGPAVLSKNGNTMVYMRAAIDYPPCVLASKTDGSGELSIEAFNHDLLSELEVGSSESVTIKGFEQEPVQMWIIKPGGFTNKRKWPLMHVIHGGPHTCFGDTWHWRWNAQLFAAKGWVLAEVNYHGSTGFGQKFVSSISGSWGHRELADVEAGTDYMLATGYIDKKRVVATGGSYGGYMVAYMNGRSAPGRYQAYVCHAGCFDWVSMMASDGYFWFGSELGAFPWQDEARVLKQSPHHYAANFTTPTLVIHGELDYRVPYYQGLGYYNTLRVKGVPTRLVFFPDENHWILKPQNSRLWYQEFFAWCATYAKPKAGKSAR